MRLDDREDLVGEGRPPPLEQLVAAAEGPRDAVGAPAELVAEEQRRPRRPELVGLVLDREVLLAARVGEGGAQRLGELLRGVGERRLQVRAEGRVRRAGRLRAPAPRGDVRGAWAAKG